MAEPSNHKITIKCITIIKCVKHVVNAMPSKTRANRLTIEDCNTIHKDKIKPCKITQKLVSVTKDKQYHLRHVQVGRQSST